jgi:hypothetical protein
MPSLAPVTASIGKMDRQAVAATVAPINCATISNAAEGPLIRPVERNPSVTAGLKCAPEMPPNALTATERAIPCASAMPTSPAPLLIGAPVLTMAAIPAKHKKKVPRNSASSDLVLIENAPPCVDRTADQQPPTRTKQATKEVFQGFQSCSSIRIR